MASTTVGMVRETTPGERRVALVPDAAARLRAAGMEVLIKAGAGTAARFPDSAYAGACAGATIAAGLIPLRRRHRLARTAPHRPHPGRRVSGAFRWPRRTPPRLRLAGSCGWRLGARRAPGGDRPDPGVVGGQAGRGALEGLRGQLDQDVPPVAGMGTAPDPPRLLEPVHEHGDRPRGERQPVAELALGQRAVGLEVLERVEVGRADTGLAGECGAHAVSLEAEPLQAGGHQAWFRRRH